MTIDGEQFYHNVVTEAVAWEKPAELQTEAERQTDTSDCVWLPNEEVGGCAAREVEALGTAGVAEAVEDQELLHLREAVHPLVVGPEHLGCLW